MEISTGIKMSVFKIDEDQVMIACAAGSVQVRSLYCLLDET